MYAIPYDDPRVQVVRRLDTAFAEFGARSGEFANRYLPPERWADGRCYGRT